MTYAEFFKAVIDLLKDKPKGTGLLIAGAHFFKTEYRGKACLTVVEVGDSFVEDGCDVDPNAWENGAFQGGNPQDYIDALRNPVLQFFGVAEVDTQEGKVGKTMSQVDALVAQAAAVARFQDTGEAEHAEEAARLAQISRVEIGPHGELMPMLGATYVSDVCTENTGGGCMVDFISLHDGRVLTLNDEAIGVYRSKDSFYADGGSDYLQFMYFEPSESGEPGVAPGKI